MSAAALVQRLRAGAVPGLNQAERNGRNDGANAAPYQEKQAAPEGETAFGTERTDGTVISVGVGKQDAESRPKRSDPYAIGAPWRPLAAAYYRHHFLCKICISAGHGRGNRCTAGADLWATYEAASHAAHDTTPRRIRT